MLLMIAGVAVLLLLLLWLDHTRTTILPAPTGSFAVGRTMYLWTDAGDHVAPMAPLGTRRQLIAWIWYPAVHPVGSGAAEDYVPASWRAALARHRGVLLSQFLTRDLSRVQTHSLCDASVSPEQQTYPVVLMRAGLAAETADYTTLAEDLASHGYVVVGVDAPYRTAVVVLPDGRVIERSPENNADLVSGPQQEQLATRLVEAWSSDMSFALDQLGGLNASPAPGRFGGRLDLGRVGVFGHSLGGATALEFCHDDARCKAGIDVDGAPLGRVITDGVTQPFLFLLGEHGGEPEAEAVMANIRAIYHRLPEDRRLLLAIHGASHYMFSDDGALLKSPMVMRVLRAVGLVYLGGARQLAVTEHCIRSFFDVYLKGADVSELALQPGYPELQPVR